MAFYSGDDEKPFDTVGVAGIDSNEVLQVSTTWSAEDVDRIRVVVDYDNVIVEVNDGDNSAEHSIDIAYAQYFGWVDQARESPLALIFIITSILVLIGVASVASRTTIDHGDGVFSDEEDWEDEEEEEYDEEYDED